ncbi:MAG: HAMP domain-containing histidine kinase [Clostridia bacterium]|nr:HAMP domain-containing histidine kinase [Clostridia bacterium]
MKNDVNIKKTRIPPDIQTLLFISMVIFGLATIVIIWFVQSKLINTFYKNAKLNEIETAIHGIEASDDESFEKACYFSSFKYKLCLNLFEIGSEKEVLSSDYSADCVIHKIPTDVFYTYYSLAMKNGGTYIDYVSTTDILNASTPAGNDNGNIIYCKIINRGDKAYFLVLDALQTPTLAINAAVGNQFIIIMLVMILTTFVLTMFLSKILSSPLSRMNQSAKQLALGNYEIKFEGNECKETYELSASLNHAASELAKADSLQKELIANVSHDLRTPLTLIRGYAEVMRDIPGENSPENIQIIIDETSHLSSLVSDMLDLSRIKAGEMLPEVSEFCITDAIIEVIERYKKFTDKNGYTLDFICDRKVYIKADRTMILQVIYNFINNAINYSYDKKEITVEQTVSGNQVSISVTDRGEGIEEDKLKYIWDRYYKIDKTHDRPKIGSGLGLSISKQILQKHSASFGVQSKPGEGSTFYFSLPTVKVEKLNKDDFENI